MLLVCLVKLVPPLYLYEGTGDRPHTKSKALPGQKSNRLRYQYLGLSRKITPHPLVFFIYLWNSAIFTMAKVKIPLVDLLRENLLFTLKNDSYRLDPPKYANTELVYRQ